MGFVVVLRLHLLSPVRIHFWRYQIHTSMREDDSDEEGGEPLLLTFGIVLLSVLIIAADGLYPLLATDYDIQFPLWVAVVTPVAMIIVVYAVIGVPVAKSRFSHLPFRRSLEKQLLWALLFLPTLVALTETALIYVGTAVLRMDPTPQLFPSWGIVILWIHTLLSILVGVPCAVGLYAVYRRLRSSSSSPGASE
jgi:hypothetical protein